MSKQNEFRKQLSNNAIEHIIEKSLNQAFGETSTRLIYDYLKMQHHLEREDILENLESFFSGLEKMLGFGAILLERRVLNELYSGMGLEFKEKEGYNFSNYIKELKAPNHLKLDEKAVVRLEHLDIAALTSLPDHLRTAVLSKLKAGGITASEVTKEIEKARIMRERPPEPVGGDKKRLTKKRKSIS